MQVKKEKEKLKNRSFSLQRHMTVVYPQKERNKLYIARYLLGKKIKEGE